MLIKKIIIKSVVQTINFLNFKPILNQNNMKNLTTFTKKANWLKTLNQNNMKKTFTLFILLSALFSGWSGVIAQINLDSGLVAHYPFNGNANDESGNANHGTVNGATHTTDRFGNANKAYCFDGVSNSENMFTFVSDESKK